MKFTILALSVLATANAESSSASLRRRLSYEKIAGYAPGSQVTDHCAIDLDQAALEEQVAKGTNEAFQSALRIYKEGGNSKSYAQITLTPPLSADVPSGTSIIGKNAAGIEVAGKAYTAYTSGDQVIKVQYRTSDIQASYVECQVGALVTGVNTEGCFEESGVIAIDGVEYGYVYNPLTDNNNGRNIAGFSTSARKKMLVDCPGCPYTDFSYFYDYYGIENYADEWVMSALNGESTSFSRGNADFSQYGFTGRAEAAKKGTAYMHIFMYVIREMEDALDDCKKGCINCNDDPVHAWDEAVCFYTGSVEGKDGLTSDGKLLHQLADKRCKDYRTCGVEGKDFDGTAAVNYEIFDLFSLGNYQLQSGNCPAARVTTKLITELMYIPLIQGTLRYAYNVDKLSGAEKEAAEGAVFAASVLPRVHAANEEAAKTIYDNMRVGATNTNFGDVKLAFESVYSDLSIDCADIGGLWNDATDSYYEGMGPCVDASTKVKVEEDKTLAVALGTSFGVLFGFALLCILCMRRKEKEGKPMFVPTVEGQAPSAEKPAALN